MLSGTPMLVLYLRSLCVENLGEHSTGVNGTECWNPRISMFAASCTV